VAWNLAGAVVPLLVALWAIPQMIAGMGTERFGLLGIVWAGIGYFSLFDLGIGAALAKLTAERLGTGRTGDLPELLDTGLRLLLGLGLFAALVVTLIAPWLLSDVFAVPEELVVEGVGSFWLLAVTLPIVTLSSGLIGILRAHQRFDQLNMVRVPLGVANFLGPVLALIATPSLLATTALLALSRLLAWLAYRHFCRPYLRSDRSPPSADRARVRELLAFGGWLTVSNVVGPLMVYFDRFVVGAVVGMAAVAFYTTPYEVVTRLWIVPEALFGVVFTALAMALAGNAERARGIYRGATRALTIAMAVPVAMIVLFAPEGLEAWLGPTFAVEGSTVLRWLAIGVFVNSFARLPFAALQASGRPDLTAKLHLVELLPYLVVLWMLTSTFGIAGTAAAWTLRIAADTLLLFWLGHVQVSALRSEQLRALAFAVVGGACLGCLAALDDSGAKAEIAVLVTVIGLAVAARERRAMRLIFAPPTGRASR
jgi:O-antigen/teichoic acid export membrane protein